MQNELPKIVIYLRVSTQRQGTSGLGLSAQRSICQQFCEQYGYEIAAEYEEVETGKGSDALSLRPKLTDALASSKKLKAPLLVAKLCRLSRDVAFISGLMAQNVRFISADVGPNCEAFHLHILAAFGERERAEISRRTKAALAAKRAKGETLGNPKSLLKAQKAGRKTQALRSQQFTDNLMPKVREIQTSGIKSLSQIAIILNSRGISAPRGGIWYPASVKRLIKSCDYGVSSEAS